MTNKAKPKKRATIRKIFLLLTNVASTVLTLLTGLRENPVIVLVSGRYDAVRSRMREGMISYGIVEDDVVDVDKLPDLKHLYESELHEYDGRDAQLRRGKGVRRTQVFFYSISAKRCGIINFRPEWVDQCVQDQQGNATQCHEYILNNFDDLKQDRSIQAGVELDFGEPGFPFLKCKGRPQGYFNFNTDLVVHQSYWAGGKYHIEVQTSECLAQPLLRDSKWVWGLFQVEQADQAANVVVALPKSGWFGTIVTFAYGIVSITMIGHGILAAFVRSRAVPYLPDSLRSTREHTVAKFLAPFMSVTTLLAENENTIITFKGSILMASDVWMNHWLYITLSVLDAVINVRMTYVILEMGTWMLGKKANFENFIFLCSALTRITWVMCLAHSITRLFFKFILRSLKTLKVVRSNIRDKLEWYVDATALFMSYKIYNLLLCVLLYLFLEFHGGTTFMKQQPWYKQGMYGGNQSIAQFWGNEIICDFFVMLSILTALGWAISVAILQTKYRYLANNGVIRLLQHRYVLVGWDAWTAAQVLGIDPYNPMLVDKDMTLTGCSIGSLLQLLYASGPSGLVHLAGDYLLVDGGFAKGAVHFHYPINAP
ncbi:hypothetical protein Poli38472_004507 [Pythium oligandrum]|uniref:Uncharacterized protein n=1 Tax=Pythium oligandrum TaxID=41045 RepID=A0A8K1CB54_PYTOL|nr:hypothetical protein Poli38472_004507 [Pythium oligandrum]|eukprot:TMW59438.1 hypothetical protein Poli38472_004507 [Pythium oligandrum]